MKDKRIWAWKIFPVDTDIQMAKAIAIKKKDKPLMVFKRLQDAVRQAGLANLDSAKITYGYIENRLEDDWNSKSLNGMLTRKYMIAWQEHQKHMDNTIRMVLEQIASEMIPYIFSETPAESLTFNNLAGNFERLTYEQLVKMERMMAAKPDDLLTYQENTENWCAVRAVKHTCVQEYNLYRSLYEAIHFASAARSNANPTIERERYERILLSALWEWEWDCTKK